MVSALVVEQTNFIYLFIVSPPKTWLSFLSVCLSVSVRQIYLHVINVVKLLLNPILFYGNKIYLTKLSNLRYTRSNILADIDYLP